MTLHARYVILDVEGLLPKKAAKATEEKKPRRVKAEVEGEAPAGARRSDLASAPKASISSNTLKSTTSSSLRVDPPEADRRLSKAERKQIRRQMRDDTD